MCGRFYIASDDESELLTTMIAQANRRQLALTGESTVARGEILPAAAVASMARGRNGEVSAFPMIWGFRRKDGKGLIINTRSETALQKPMFRQSMLERRCLLPASWYFEWEKREKEKIRYAIRPKEQGVIFLAGIYRYEEDRKLPVCSILTREPAEEIAFIHDRMPVIFTENTCGAWLDRDSDPEEILQRSAEDMAFRTA